MFPTYQYIKIRAVLMMEKYYVLGVTPNVLEPKDNLSNLFPGVQMEYGMTKPIVLKNSYIDYTIHDIECFLLLQILTQRELSHHLTLIGIVFRLCCR